MSGRFRYLSACLVFTLAVSALVPALATAQAAPLAPPVPAPSAPIPGPTLQEAQKGIATAQAVAVKLGVLLSCVVVDSRGDLVALSRMDGARFFTTDVARGKALLSATFGQPSGNFAQMGSSPFFQNLNTAAQGRLYPVQGAVPILRNNQVLGAIGCSGASSQQDEEAAKAGLAVF